jgi:hypothetical protein
VSYSVKQFESHLKNLNIDNVGEHIHIYCDIPYISEIAVRRLQKVSKHNTLIILGERFKSFGAWLETKEEGKEVIELFDNNNLLSPYELHTIYFDHKLTSRWRFYLSVSV